MAINDFYEKAKLLKECISEYEIRKNDIYTGIDIYDSIKWRKKRILKSLNASERDWKDYKWQLANLFNSSDSLSSVMDITPQKLYEMKIVEENFRFAISPYYLSLTDYNNSDCPIGKQCLPDANELDEKGSLDPMDEGGTSINCNITRRYPDRLIINVTNLCGTLCRHCQRKRLFEKHDSSLSKKLLLDAFEYIKNNTEIRDILVTGGDAFLLSDEKIEWILKELTSIKHVEIIRLGTRTPVTLPQRITKNLTRILKKHHPIYVNTQFNHPLEITPESKKACEMLADSGVPIGNQMVLLNRVNNDKYVVRKLNQQLLKIRVKPYYIFHPKHVKGTRHFWVTIQEGIEIMESLRGFTSGMAVPYYIVNGPKGLGKSPVLPHYLLSLESEKGVFRNWQGKTFEL